MKSEFIRVMEIIEIIFKALDFQNFEAQISLRDPNNREKYVGSDEVWEKAENAIIEACREKGLNAKVEYGEAAFYGPKLDFMVKDAIGRRWQLGTIQVDYNLPERFKLEYTDEDNTKKTPVMIHRAPFGSLERFCAVLIEHTAGHFPLWLTPDQVAILPISEKFNDISASKGERFKPTVDLGGWVRSNNESSIQKNNSTFWQLKNYITYSNQFGKHGLVAMVGQECWESKYDFTSVFSSGLPSNDIHNPALGNKSSYNISAGFGSSAMASFFTRWNYNYDDKYLATYTYRYDGSSNFGPNKRWAVF